MGQVAGALVGCGAVVHLGAYPAPYGHADEVVFINNVRATFATLQAASLLGVKKAVIASSLSALGTAWALEPFAPLYAPVDEAHPNIGTDPYALSKEVDEATGELYVACTALPVDVAIVHADRLGRSLATGRCCAPCGRIIRMPTLPCW